MKCLNDKKCENLIRGPCQVCLQGMFGSFGNQMNLHVIFALPVYYLISKWFDTLTWLDCNTRWASFVLIMRIHWVKSAGTKFTYFMVAAHQNLPLNKFDESPVVQWSIIWAQCSLKQLLKQCQCFFLMCDHANWWLRGWAPCSRSS